MGSASVFDGSCHGSFCKMHLRRRRLSWSRRGPPPWPRPRLRTFCGRCGFGAEASVVPPDVSLGLGFDIAGAGVYGRTDQESSEPVRAIMPAFFSISAASYGYLSLGHAHNRAEVLSHDFEQALARLDGFLCAFISPTRAGETQQKSENHCGSKHALPAFFYLLLSE